jgi:hypothetical protein
MSQKLTSRTIEKQYSNHEEADSEEDNNDESPEQDEHSLDEGE